MRELMRATALNHASLVSHYASSMSSLAERIEIIIDETGYSKTSAPFWPGSRRKSEYHERQSKTSPGNDELYMPGWPMRQGGGNGGGKDDMSELQHRVARLEITTETLRDELRDFKNEVRGWRSDLAEDMREQRQDAKSLRYQVWGAALTVLLAMVGFIYSHTQSLLAAIDTGRESARAVEQMVEKPVQQSLPTVR